MSKKTLEHILNVVFLFALLFLSIWLGYGLFRSANLKQSEHANSYVKAQQSQYPDYDNFNTSKQLEVVENFKTIGNVANGKSLKKYFLLNEKNSIESAYIYIEASVNGKPLGFYDDLYLKINNTGGHLIKDSNLLQAPPRQNVSVYLFPLSSISYKPNRDSKLHKFVTNYDFLTNINESQKLDIVAHINSKKKDKVLIKVTIGYSCFDGINCNFNQ